MNRIYPWASKNSKLKDRLAASFGSRHSVQELFFLSKLSIQIRVHLAHIHTRQLMHNKNQHLLNVQIPQLALEFAALVSTKSQLPFFHS